MYIGRVYLCSFLYKESHWPGGSQQKGKNNPGFNLTKLRDYEIKKLRNFEITKLQNCKITKLRGSVNVNLSEHPIKEVHVQRGIFNSAKSFLHQFSQQKQEGNWQNCSFFKIKQRHSIFVILFRFLQMIWFEPVPLVSQLLFRYTLL